MVFLILLFNWPGEKEDNPPVSQAVGRTRLAVVIPCRNEAGRLPELLQDLIPQGVGSDRAELLIVDDHSTDGTTDAAQKAIHLLSNARLIALQSEETGKKAALRRAVESSAADIFLCLDADVRVGPLWLSTASAWMQRPGIRMSAFPVAFSPCRNLPERWMTLEFTSLLAFTAGTIRAGWPVMCNGANFGFARDAWDARAIRSELASGDDVFLLHHVASKWGPRAIAFGASRHAMATTAPPAGWTEFIAQRVRWASKAGAYRLPAARLLTLIILFTNMAGFLILAGLPAGCISIGSGVTWFAVKTAMDVLFTLPAAQWAGSGRSLRAAPLLAISYPVYTVAVLIGSLFWRPTWKGRTISLRSRS